MGYLSAETGTMAGVAVASLVGGELGGGFLQGLTQTEQWKAVGVKAATKLPLSFGVYAIGQKYGDAEGKQLAKLGAVCIAGTIGLDVLDQVIAKRGGSTWVSDWGRRRGACIRAKVQAWRGKRYGVVRVPVVTGVSPSPVPPRPTLRAGVTI